MVKYSPWLFALEQLAYISFKTGNDARCSTTCLCLGKPIYADPSKCPSSISSPALGWLSAMEKLSGTDGASWEAGLRMGRDSALGRSNSTGTVLRGEKSKHSL